MATIYGTLASLLGLLLLVMTAREFLRKRSDLPIFLFWSTLWVTLIMTGLYPEPYVLVVTWLGMSTPIHFVTSFGIVILLAITYQLYRRTSEINTKLIKSIQELALLSSQMTNPEKPKPRSIE